MQKETQKEKERSAIESGHGQWDVKQPDDAAIFGCNAAVYADDAAMNGSSERERKEGLSQA
eukprot:963676-Rhodomonas_salina.1